VRYLATTQNPDGSWSESLITGTGFPRVFYLKYDMYRNNWPVMALSRYATAAGITEKSAQVRSDAAEVSEADSSLQQVPEPVLSSIVSSFASLPIFEIVKDLLTKLNHG
jgi:Squalene-hopene cyclase C-terminal domain